MAFRPPKKQPQFADLKGILAQSKETENSLYQVVQEIIERLTQLQQVTAEQLDGVANSEDLVKKFASKLPTYHTKDNETSLLPNSVQLLAGAGIIFNDSTPNIRVIETSTGAGHYDSPLTDGDTVEAHLIFAAGECIIVQVPV